MDLEVIQGSHPAAIGAVTTTLFSANQLIGQANDWATWPGYKWPDGSGGIRVRFWPFSGPTKALMDEHFLTNSFPGAFFAVRVLAETEVKPTLSFGMAGSYWYYSQDQANDAVETLREYCDTWIRNRSGLSPTDAIPASAWDVQDIPYTRETNTVLGGFIEGLTGFFARFLPFMVLARSAFLTLVRRNFRGLASKMAANDPATVRRRWEDFGGNYATLRDAVEAGARQPVGKGDDNVNTGGGSVDNSGGSFDALLAAAKPILDMILSSMGINLDLSGDPEPADQGAPPPPASTGSVVPVLIGLGLFAAVVLSSTPKKKSTRKR